METFFSSEYGLAFSIMLIILAILFFYLGVQAFNMYVHSKVTEFQSGASVSNPNETEAEMIARINKFLREGWEKDGKSLARDRKNLFGY